MSALPQARTYNQNHVPRAHTGGRRISIYWTWSYPWESQRDPAAMENRFSTMTEVRNVLWPGYETPEYDAANFLQGIAGTLELFHRSALAFQEIAGEATGHPVAVFQRIDQAGYKLPIDERILADTDTLMVFGLDHLLSEQEAAPEEIDAITEWLQTRRHLPAAGAASRCRLHRRLRPAPGRVRTPRRPPRAASTTLQPVHPLADEGARRAGAQQVGTAARGRRGHQGDRAADRHPRPRQPRGCSTTSPPSTSTRTFRTTSSPGRKARTCRCSAVNASTRTGRTHSPRRATRSSTP